MKVFLEGNSPVKAWIDGVDMEQEAYKQLLNVSNLPFIGSHIAVMPDVHAGKGSTVGSVIPTVNAIVPAVVGVDIGCGMIAHETNLTSHDLPDNLSGLRSLIERNIPHGRTDNGGSNDRGAWNDVPEWILQEYKESGLYDRFRKNTEDFQTFNAWADRSAKHLGTLGTGNHFVEICLDERDKVWIMLHSGSRGVGNKIGSFFIEKAKEEMKRWFINIPDMDLAYLPEGSEYFAHYVRNVQWASDYAFLNRKIMMKSAFNAFQEFLGPNKILECGCTAVNCHHNYVSKERHYGKDVWLARKGAVSAKLGELGIIPGSMGARSFIVEGKGNRESFCSCSHGAGRKMSRNEARKRFSIEDHVKATEGIECRKDSEVIDETPAAYKDIDAVMKAQEDLVSIKHTLRQIVCVKG